MTYALKGTYEVEQGDSLKEELLALLNSGNSNLQLDLSEVEFMDISCIQILFSFIKEVRAEQLMLSIPKPSDDILQFFFMSGFIKSSSYFESSDLLDILAV